MKSRQAILLTAITIVLFLFQLIINPATADTNYGSFSITIQNYHGSPLKDVKVQLINSTTGQIEATGTSGSDGKVTLTAWKNEPYTLKAIYLEREVGIIENWNFSSPSSPKTIRVGVFNVKIRGNVLWRARPGT
jgi:hypothetical protein